MALPGRANRVSRAMEQVYYTQCPVGYGLGASNGFQVKRLSAGYPLSGDFSHLGLRPFVATTRALAPTVLRYRLAADGRAEVARLSARSHEYETERGLWGRPGGHFAHGLLLGPGEMASLRHWPAGLLGQDFWKTTDPQPTRGRPPDPVALTSTIPDPLAEFPAAAALAEAWDADRLAGVLSALAAATREGRTLVLLDRPERLAGDMALLTLAFPEAWRGALTFSTYHDRPDELHGFRLHGTVADPRLNRAALLANGFIADLTKGTLEPTLRPSSWASTLAGWLVRHRPEDREAWEATGRRAASARLPEPANAAWSDEWMDGLYGFHDGLKSSSGPTDWPRFGKLAAWSSASGSSIEWASARPPSWFRDKADGSDEARAALLAHLRLKEGWKGHAAAWGEAVARWLERCPPGSRKDVFLEVLGTCPEGERPGFVRGLVASAPADVAREAPRWVRSQAGTDPALLLPLEVRGAVERLSTSGEKGPLRDVLARASATPSSLSVVLDAIAAEAERRPDLTARLGKLVAERVDVDGGDEQAGRSVLRWALRQATPEVWIGPTLRMISARPDALEAWRSLRGRVEPDGLRAFAAAALAVAGGPGVRDEVFRWCVESLLLSVPETDRPHDARWAGLYLDKTPSGLDLMRRLFGREYRESGLKAWIDGAKARGELSTGQTDRIDGAVRYARVLKTGDVRALLRIDLPVVPPSERGVILRQVLSHVGSASNEALATALDTCRAAWPGGFSPGADGLSGLAEPLADLLGPECGRPDVWLGRLGQVVDRLGAAGFEPGGLAAHVIAASTRKDSDDASPWRLRQFLLNGDLTWRALAEDVRRDLDGKTAREAAEVLDDWDRRLAKGIHTARFFEVWLNASEGSALAAAVASRAGDLRTLPDLPWWEHGGVPDGRDDVRDAFARLGPIAPLPEEALQSVQTWMRRPPLPDRPSVVRRDGPADLVPLEVERPPVRDVGAPPGVSALSPLGMARWRCVEALSGYYRAGVEGEGCWQAVAGWTSGLPLDRLDREDRLLFVSWLIPKLEEPDSLKVARLASWLARSGLTEPDQLTGWAERLAPFTNVPHAVRLARAVLVADLKAEMKTVLRERVD